MKTSYPVKILLVDDKSENLFALEVILSNEHYLYVKASSGNEALKILLQQQDFSIILMDVQMPEMDGFETSELIRGIEKLKHIPIIFLTASMDSSVQIFKGYQAGAVDYMIKPFSPEILKAKVAVFVELYKKNHELLSQKEEMERLIRDMKNQKRIEYELIEGKNNAEKATQKAEESANLKDAFLSIISHEIRTPLNAIMGFSNVLLKGKLGATEKEQVGIVKTAGENLLTIMNDIIDLSMIEAGTITFTENNFSIQEIFQTTNKMFAEKAKEKNLTLLFAIDKDVPNILVGDQTRLIQIINNLMSNAIKFTEKGTINVCVRSFKNESSLLEFSVTDTGIGISADNLKTIFNRFTQVEDHNKRKYGGLGLGLAIAKRLVDRQGGALTVESKLNEGSTFAFSIPLKKST